MLLFRVNVPVRALVTYNSCKKHIPGQRRWIFTSFYWAGIRAKNLLAAAGIFAAHKRPPQHSDADYTSGALGGNRDAKAPTLMVA